MTGWRTVPLGELLTESRIEAKASDPERRITVKLNMKGVQRREPTAEKEGATRYYVRRAGQFIYGKQNLHKGAFGVIPKELDGHQSSSDLPAFDVAPVIAPEWIYYWLVKGETWRAFEKLARGVGSKRTNVDDFFRFKISYPIDKSEQQRIINRIRATEQKHEALTTELTHQRALLKQLRQAILQEAVQGKLTAAWRGSHPDPESSSGVSGSHHASELLKRIRAEKEALVKAGKLRKPKPLPPIKPEEVPFELPEGWVWARLGDLRNPNYTITYGVLVPGPDEPSGVPFVRIQDLDFAGEGVAPSKHIAPEVDAQYRRTNLRGGEILIGVVGGVGKLAIAPNSWKGANIARAVARLVANELIDHDYLFLALSSPWVQSYFNKGYKSIQPTLNVAVLERTPIPVPPISEQQRIQALVKTKLVECDEMGRELGVSNGIADSLLQSALSEVMGGPGAVRYAEAGDELPMAAEPQAKRGRSIKTSTQAHEGQ